MSDLDKDTADENLSSIDDNIDVEVYYYLSTLQWNGVVSYAIHYVDALALNNNHVPEERTKLEQTKASLVEINKYITIFGVRDELIVNLMQYISAAEINIRDSSQNNQVLISRYLGEMLTNDHLNLHYSDRIAKYSNLYGYIWSNLVSEYDELSHILLRTNNLLGASVRQSVRSVFDNQIILQLEDNKLASWLAYLESNHLVITPENFIVRARDYFVDIYLFSGYLSTKPAVAAEYTLAKSYYLLTNKASQPIQTAKIQ
ncbi:hypothetical protein KC678_02295 [Candidatus Dojkabacteria bacterium]|uniref:Uncharacterized protein n=1 Tax=Candidatus Dojkabacteria bacterium TaxID=2099670 RepID=A0A955IAW0_9BACT|nr:hypothetical protein [Candidatus Dojkabacteria bacterium]